MPTYSYRCTDCDHAFEVFQKITDDPITRCAKCGKGTAKRGIGGGYVSFQFKGTGYYLTDYKRSENSKSEGACGCSKKDCCK